MRRKKSRIGRTLRGLAKKIIKRKNRKRNLRIMYAKGRKTKPINKPQLKRAGIMLTA